VKTNTVGEWWIENSMDSGSEPLRQWLERELNITDQKKGELPTEEQIQEASVNYGDKYFCIKNPLHTQFDSMPFSRLDLSNVFIGGTEWLKSKINQ
jgi:hypothetical protein